MQLVSRLPILLLIAWAALLSLHGQQTPQKSAKVLPRSLSLLVPYVPTVSGASFTANYEVQMQQPLASGGSESWHSTTLVARDSSGRIRHELYAYAPASFTKEPPLLWIVLTDPVARLRHLVDPARRTENREWFHASHSIPLGTGSPADEDLGTKDMGGLAVRGERRTWTRRYQLVASGQPVQVTDETWYSDKLQLVVFEQQKDTAGVVLTIAMSRFDPSEPAASLFRVPQGYRVLNWPNAPLPSRWGSPVPGPDPDTNEECCFAPGFPR